MKRTLLAAALSAAFVATPAAAVGFTEVWTYNHPVIASEIPAFDALTGTVWVAGVEGVDVLNAATGAFVQHIDTTAFGSINSVAIYNGVAAFAMENSDRTLSGTVQFYNTSSFANTGNVTVGALPDMLTFTKNGAKLLVANEGTPTTYGVDDPAGTVSIIDMNTRSVAATVSFAGAPTSGSAIRTNTGMDFEPEYIAINAAGTQAFVTLQEANAMGVIDLTNNTATQVIGLGVKDFSLAGNEIDPNHKDDKIELRAAAVKGFYQPDAIATYAVGGQTYVVMANEGDTREDDGDKARAKDSGLAGVPDDLKQLNISTTDSTSGDLYTFGGRSFSIRDAAGNIVFDSGNQLDAAAITLGIYNDGRSDDKGVEPEGVTIMTMNGRTYAFIGLERTTKSAVVIFDITDPAHSILVDTIVGTNDVSPEGLVGFELNGENFLAVAHEVSNTTTTYRLSAPVPEAETYAMMLVGMGLVGFMARRRKAA